MICHGGGSIEGVKICKICERKIECKDCFVVCIATRYTHRQATVCDPSSGLSTGHLLVRPPFTPTLAFWLD